MSDPFDPSPLANRIATVLAWAIAIAATLFAASAQPVITALWFPAGYVANRILPRPPRPGVRVQIWMAMIVGTGAAAALFHSWGPVIWFAAGWAAFSATFNPEE